MGDLRVDHIAATKLPDVVFQTAPLRFFAREQGDLPAVFVMRKAGHDKADGTVNARNDRNIPHAALADANRAFLARDHALHTPQIHRQIMRRVTEDSARFQNIAVLRRFMQQSRRLKDRQVFPVMNALALGQIVRHFITSVNFGYKTGYVRTVGFMRERRFGGS